MSHFPYSASCALGPKEFNFIWRTASSFDLNSNYIPISHYQLWDLGCTICVVVRLICPVKPEAKYPEQILHKKNSARPKDKRWWSLSENGPDESCCSQWLATMNLVLFITATGDGPGNGCQPMAIQLLPSVTPRSSSGNSFAFSAQFIFFSVQFIFFISIYLFSSAGNNFSSHIFMLIWDFFQGNFPWLEFHVLQTYKYCSI